MVGMQAKPTGIQVLVADDEPNQVELLAHTLQQAGFAVITANDGAAAAAVAESAQPDIAILDWMMPEMSGIEVCRQLQTKGATKHIPIIMVSARGETPDRTHGLDSGADDYITKPFSPQELVARVKAVLRRARPELTGEVLEFADVKLFPSQKRVERGGVMVKLGAKEFGLLAMLLARPTQVFSRRQLLDKIWGVNIYVEERTVDVHISRLRKALDAASKAQQPKQLIRSIRSMGYTLAGDG